MAKGYEERTKAELQSEARKRDIATGGTKQELADRLNEADEQNSRGTSASSGARNGSDGAGKRRPMDLARLAGAQLAELTGKSIDGISGFVPDDQGWRVTLDVVEIARVPSATDVMGCYEVVVDADGDLLAYERVRRYVRGATSED